MATIKARRVALAAVIAGGMLCEALICEPAQAGTTSACPVQSGASAFQCTNSTATNNFYASLELFDGSTLIEPPTTTNGFQGWVSDVLPAVPPIGGPNGPNTSYTVGNAGNMLMADYFGFNLSKVPESLTVTSAVLVVYSGIVNTNLKLNLVAATQYAGQLLTPPVESSTVYNELVNGKNVSYGIFSISENTSNPLATLMFTLNDAATAEINAQIQDKSLQDKLFVVSGSVTDTPEPSTWVMMLTGFAGLGVVARRHAARRRAAAATG
jgi:PEP-CTERM motif